MDILERAEADRIQREETLQAARAKREERPRTDIPAADYPVTIIGCIRGRDGWYQAGYNERKKTIISLGRITRPETLHHNLKQTDTTEESRRT